MPAPACGGLNGDRGRPCSASSRPHKLLTALGLTKQGRIVTRRWHGLGTEVLHGPFGAAAAQVGQAGG